MGGQNEVAGGRSDGHGGRGGVRSRWAEVGGVGERCAGRARAGCGEMARRGRWSIEAQVRECGGGCGSSRVSPAGSVTLAF